MAVAVKIMNKEKSVTDIENGLIKHAKYKPSSHYDERPAGDHIDLIVIHSISLPPGEFGGEAIDDFFCGKLKINGHQYYSKIAHLRVSSHVLIRRDGEIVQFVPFQKRAWHAGESSFQGRSQCNNFSIGIELEGSDDVPYEGEQYRQLGTLCMALMSTYPAITGDRIVGHADIAPLRKTDPGPMFDWKQFKRNVK